MFSIVRRILFIPLPALLSGILLIGCSDSSSQSPSNNLSSEAIFLDDLYTLQKDELFITDSSNESVKKLSHSIPDAGTIANFSISSDGQYVAYTAKTHLLSGTRLYITDLATEITLELSSEYIYPADPTSGITEFQWSPNGQFIAYITNRQDNSSYGRLHIYDTVSQSTTVAPFKNVFYALQWSPDNRRLAYVGRTDGAIYNFGLYAFNIADNSDILLSSPYQAGEKFYTNSSNYQWSPDGQFLLYHIGSPSGELKTYCASVENPSVYTLSAIETVPEQWAWSSDSSLLAYLTYPTATAGTQLAVVDPAGSNNTILSQLADSSWHVTKYFWLDQGSQLIYHAASFPAGTTKLFYVSIQDAIHSEIVPSNFSGQPFSSAFYLSPDKNYFAYLAKVPGSDKSRAFLVDLATYSQSEISASITDLEAVREPVTWAPDSRKLVFGAETQYSVGLYCYNINTQTTLKVSQQSEVTGGNLDPASVSWTSDSQSIYYLATFNSPIHPDLYRSSIQSHSVHLNFTDDPSFFDSSSGPTYRLVP